MHNDTTIYDGFYDADYVCIGRVSKDETGYLGLRKDEHGDMDCWALSTAALPGEEDTFLTTH